MSENPRHPLSLKPVLYTLPAGRDVSVRSDIALPAADGGTLLVDIYQPPDAVGGPPWPVVVLVPGYVDAGMRRVLGCRHKEMASTTSWARLIAASGMMAIAYSNRAPAADLAALLNHLTSRAPSFGIDAARVGLWASSGNVPVALSAMMRGAPVALSCAALCYGYAMDLDGSTEVANAARTFGFENAAAGRTIEDLSPGTSLLIVRAGRDEMPGLNAALDRFVAAALARNLPLSLINHAAGPHAFDLLDDSATTREAVRQVLQFLRFHLRRDGLAP